MCVSNGHKFGFEWSRGYLLQMVQVKHWVTHSNICNVNFNLVIETLLWTSEWVQNLLRPYYFSLNDNKNYYLNYKIKLITKFH